MMKTNAGEVFTAIGSILKYTLKITLLATYLICRIVEQLAAFGATICERYVK